MIRHEETVGTIEIIGGNSAITRRRRYCRAKWQAECLAMDAKHKGRKRNQALEASHLVFKHCAGVFHDKALASMGESSFGGSHAKT